MGPTLTTPRAADPYLFGERIERAVGHHARECPDAIAVQQGRDQLTYAQLWDEAGKVAAALAGLGIGAGAYVPVPMDRSVRQVATLLGILRAGAAYIAVDVSWPRDRVEDVIERSGSRVTADAEFYAGLPAAQFDGPDLSDGTAAACVFFTSGSTGRPKGVISPHRGAIRTLVQCPEIPLGRDSVFLQCAPISWDAHSLELWAPLLNGGRCVLLAAGSRAVDAIALRGAIELGVNSLWLTSSLFNVLLEEDPGIFSGICLLLTGGERVSAAHARQALERYPGLRLVNGYGPVESTIFTTVHRVRPEDVAEGATEVPIGTPVPRTGLLLLGEDGQPAPAGQVGEIIVSGDGVALGYLGDPEESRDRFLTLDGVRYYRTGDLALAGSDGALRYRGRADRQFKVNGLRIEPGEVEAVIESHPRVSSCCVVRLESPSGRPQVGCAYATSDAAPVDLTELRAFAARRLLVGMLPTVARHVPRLPLGSTGKADSAAVARLLAEGVEPSAGRRLLADEDAAPFLSEVRALLGQPGLTADDDLIAAGMTSLDAIRLSARLGARSHARVPALDVYRSRTVARLLAGASALGALEPDPPLSAGRGAGETAVLSHAQERFWLAEQFSPGAVDNLIVLAYLLDGPLDAGALQAAMSDVVARHPALRTVYQWTRSGAVQRVQACEEAGPQVELMDVPPESRAWPPGEVAARLTADWWDKPFSLGKEAPLRARLLRLGEAQHVLCLHAHHIAFDGWSEEILVRDLRAAYAARMRGDRLLPDRAALTYADYSAWERAQSDRWTTMDLPFWQGTLASCPAPVLPAPPGGAEATRLERVIAVEPDVVAGLTRAAAGRGVPVTGALLAASAQALARAFGARDICLGTLTAGRAMPQVENLIGYFVNPLAVPVPGAIDQAPGDLLGAVGERYAAILDHGRAPFDRLVHEMKPDRERHPWFQAWAVMQNPVPRGEMGPGVMVEPLRISPPRTSFELMLEAFPQPDGGWEVLMFRRADGMGEESFGALLGELDAGFRRLSLLGR